MMIKPLLIFITFSFTCKAQIKKTDDFCDINYKYVMEINGFIYYKADTTLVTGKVIRYNKKNIAKSYVLVSNGKPDNFGWVHIKNKYQEPEKKIKTSGTRVVVNEEGQVIGSIEAPFYKNYDQMSDRNDISKDIQLTNNVPDLKNSWDMGLKDEKLKKDGLWQEYYKNGNLRIVGNYVEGKKDGIWKEYYEKGQLKSELNYIEGKKENLLKLYHPNGNLKGKINYKDGKEEGIFEMYNSDGQLMIIGKFKEGKQIGEWKYYNEIGELINIENFGD